MPADDAPSTQRRSLLRRLSHDSSAVVGLGILALFAIMAIGAPWIAPYDPAATDFGDRYASPSVEHPLGTDNLGRDVFSRIVHGSRISLGMAFAATVGITVVGSAAGLVAGTYGRVVDAVVARIADVFLALPTLILALVVVGLLGQGLRNLVITIIIVGWPTYARIVRGTALSVRERPFIEAARAAGATRLRILGRHLAPNVIGPVIVLSTLDMGRVLLAVSGLSFLGFGVPPPTSEWGGMLSEAKAHLDRAPQLLAYPGMAITLAVLAFNLAGDGLRDLLDPRSATTEEVRDRHALSRAGHGRWS